MVLVMCRLARRMTGSTALGLVAGLLLSLDGLQFVLSRLALLDIFLAFFILCAVSCLVADRDWYRAKLARLVPDQVADPASYGPVRGLLFRPWLLASGICWGLALGTKWTAIYPLAAFGVMVWLWSAGARRSFGVRWATLRSIVTDGVPAFVHLVVIGGIVYTATWTGWLVHADEYEESLSSTQYTQFVKEQPCKETVKDDGTTETAENNLDNSGKRWPTASEPDAHGVGEADPVTAVAVLLPPRRLHVPHALPELLRAHLRLQAVGLAAPQPPGRRRGRHRHRAGHPRLRRGQRAAPASSRCC